MQLTYEAQTGLTNDKTGKRWEAGDTVKDGDFTKKVVAHWLKKGVLTVKDGDDGSNSHNG